MFDSIYKDVKYEIDRGGIITKLILVFLLSYMATFVIQQVTLLSANSEINHSILNWMRLPNQLYTFLQQPWSLLTHTFVQQNLFYLLFKLIIIYYFGNITADLIGAKNIIPILFCAQVLSSISFILTSYFVKSSEIIFVSGISSLALAFVGSSVSISPNYNIKLILIGNIKIKYIAIVLIILALSSSNSYNQKIYEIFGFFGGYLYIIQNRGGLQFLNIFNLDKSTNRAKIVPLFRKNKMEIIEKNSFTNQNEKYLDQILEKIKISGKDSLTIKESNFLKQYKKN